MLPAAMSGAGALPVGAITWGAPILAWGVLACAIPVLVHLVMREKSRHQLFPAMRLLMRSTPSGRQAQRLRHLLLLACRVMLILLLVGVLIEPGCSVSDERVPTAWLEPAGEPVSAVLCLDDSASMGYRFQGLTRLRAAARQASKLIADTRRFEPGSE